MWIYPLSAVNALRSALGAFLHRFTIRFSLSCSFLLHGRDLPAALDCPPICADRISFDLDFARWELPAEVDSDRVWFTLDQDGNLAEI